MTEEITKPTPLLIKDCTKTHKKGIHHQKMLPGLVGQRQDGGHSHPLCHMGLLGAKARWQGILTWDHMAGEKKNKQTM